MHQTVFARGPQPCRLTMRQIMAAPLGGLLLAAAQPALAEEAADAAADTSLAEGDPIIVIGTATVYNNSETTEPMVAQQSPITSPLALIDNLPGVSVQEGDTFGFDDWSTSVSIRGFQTTLDTQQIGITIDGLPNGGSAYGGGSKANRFIDTMNIGGVAVSQGTADIGALSNEALGGTIDFRTDDPVDERRMRVSATLGQFDAQRFYGRYDTGLILGDQVKAWISGSYQEATDWASESADNHRTHFAGKFVTTGPIRITGYAAYDDTLENNYDQVYSAQQFALAPDTDQLIGNWTGVPYVDQSYRQVWGTLRENFFTYLKAEGSIGDSLDLKGAVYFHNMVGRGDWAPYYVVDVLPDGTGPQSELVPGNTVNGGQQLGRFYFVDANGVALSPIAGCVGTLKFPYGGTTDPAVDPACYQADAIPVQSYRHTHYRKHRIGGTGEAIWHAQLAGGENQLRGGIWYEDSPRKEHRDWHLLVDARVGPEFYSEPYWTQYSREYPQTTFKWYAEEQFEYGPVTATAGIKQFRATVDRRDQFGQSADVDLTSTSKVLFSGGLQYRVVPDVTLFGGYAENYKALTDSILEVAAADLDRLKPETSRNIEAGVRYTTGRLQASATYFNSVFKNRLIFLSANSGSGIDYLGEGSGTWLNAGGIDAEGVELVASYRLLPSLGVYASYTHTDATYRGTGDADLDAENGIVDGNQVTGIPKDMFVLSADWNSGPFVAGVSGKYTGKRFVNRANSWEADSYFLTDVYIGVNGEGISDVLKSMSFRLVANNVTDESYLGGISSDAAWIGAPRTVSFTVTADF
ncbi:TonB-dependent receptor [Altererythrobacter sp. B11]|uniref:TonB-dependent receptor n=1 Tax=Altererythrobacter sp. B11 TaxID=2060312 RepID=UPI000DC6F160|nr:TonB-dependent receptor [Altererythrobacter sp. B11]BBC74355.1 TonB-dependent receptor [Altererythrobacter sp. B11]